MKTRARKSADGRSRAALAPTQAPRRPRAEARPASPTGAGRSSSSAAGIPPVVRPGTFDTFILWPLSRRASNDLLALPRHARARRRGNRLRGRPPARARSRALVSFTHSAQHPTEQAHDAGCEGDLYQYDLATAVWQPLPGAALQVISHASPAWRRLFPKKRGGWGMGG